MTTKEEGFGAWLRRKREARSISQRSLARGVGVSSAYLSWVERDLCAPPAEARLRSIAKILDLNADEGFGSSRQGLGRSDGDREAQPR
jgi:transcriptional regulator with XRE-family HTH domain